METPIKFLLLTITFSLLFNFINGSSKVDRQPYIVYMGDTPRIRTSAVDDHHRLLMTAIGDEKIAIDSKIHSYGKSFNAFAARLLPHEAQRLKDMEGVVSVFPNTMLKLHTTRSWDYLGLTPTVARNNKVESNIIVGLLDSGIYVSNPSFDDKGYGPPPAKWKGKCQKGGNFTGCNNKVIGARFYNKPDSSDANKAGTPADTEGHGTHTASTIAGTSIVGANFYGLAKGTARGGVPSARIAMYKVCTEFGCSSMDILAGFDDAIDDGVDLISVSLGGGAGPDYFSDPIAIGAFHATQKGIFTACSAGNDGPDTYSIVNVAPWILTVAASAIDRQFTTEVRLGNGKNVQNIEQEKRGSLGYINQETMMFESNHCGRSLYPRFMSVSSKDLIFSSTDNDLDAIKAEKRLIEMIVKDEKDKLVNHSKNLFQVISNEQNLENTETEVIYRRFALRLLFLACHIDSVECAEALLVGKIGLGVQVNELDEFGKIALHCAAEMHSK